MCTSRTVRGTRYLVTSTDAGSTWQPARTLPTGTFGVIAAASAPTVAVATGAVFGAGTRKLLITTDGGTTWRTAATDIFPLETVGIAWLGFETSRVGWWVADPHSVFSTTDGGAHWAMLPFR